MSVWAILLGGALLSLWYAIVFAVILSLVFLGVLPVLDWIARKKR